MTSGETKTHNNVYEKDQSLRRLKYSAHGKFYERLVSKIFSCICAADARNLEYKQICSAR